MALIGARRALISHKALDPATTAWVAAVVAAGGTVSGARRTIVDTFIKSLKAYSLWTTFDRYWLLAGENTQSALIDMVGLVSATNNGATFTANQGYTSVAGPGYVASNFIPSTNGVNYTLNSAVAGGQVQTNRTIGSNVAEFGGSDAGFVDVLSFNGLNNSGSQEVRVNSSGSDVVAGTTARGSWIASRTGASVGALYRNGSSIGAITTTSTALPTASIAIGAFNQGGSVVTQSLDQNSSMFFAAGWNATQAANFETAQNAMMTSIGINVH